MNKKQIIKEQKRLKQERKEVETLFKDDKDVLKVFKIALGVILFIGAVFVFINIFNGNWDIFTSRNKKATEIDSHMVMVGNLFNREEGEYMVLAYDMKSEDTSFYGGLIANYESKPNLYYLDLSSGFNDNFIGDKTVVSSDLNKLKFAGPTLLFIKGDKITKSYTNEKDIVNYFVKK